MKAKGSSLSRWMIRSLFSSASSCRPLHLSRSPHMQTCTYKSDDSTLLLLRLDEPRLSCCWAVCEHNVGSELRAACAQLDIKSLVTKISSIKHVLEFYKSIKTEIVCVCLCALLASSHQISQAAAAPGAHMASPQHPPKAPYC